MNKLVFILLLVIICGASFFAYKKYIIAEVPRTEFALAYGDIINKVVVDGNTKAVQSVDLAFETGGKIASTTVEVGSSVKEGDVLAYLDDAELKTEMARARASITSNQAVLDQLRKGSTAEQIEVREAEVSQAEVALRDAEKSMYDKAVDIVNNTIDQFFSNLNTSYPQFNLTVTDHQLKQEILAGRMSVGATLKNWSADSIDAQVREVSRLIEDIAFVVNSQTPSSIHSQATLDAYKTAMSTARATLLTSQEAINAARTALVLSKKNLSLTKSGNTPETIKAQVARVAQDQAVLQSIETRFSKMMIKSPIDGVVTTQEAKRGQVVTSGAPLISVMSLDDMQIEANVSEVKIAAVSVGDSVHITFEAFPSKQYAGSVVYIDPAETLIAGIVNYKVKVAMAEKYPEIKNGLTARLEIITDTKKQVLFVPEYTLLRRGNQTLVSKRVGEEYVEVPVTLGETGEGGFVEVLSGLNSGDIIDASPR